MKFNIFPYLICLISCFLSCQKNYNNNRSIVIIHDNDVHCAVDGYVKFAGLRDAIIATDTAYVLTVSSGDFLQGEFIGSYSRGGFLVDIMKAIGFDAVTIGNHEFDYGIPRQLEIMSALGRDKVVCSNFINTERHQTEYATYVIKTCGTKKVAFVGVVTPGTMNTSYNNFKDMSYDIPKNETISLVQSAVNEALEQGADYVILLSHLGDIIDLNTDINVIPLIKNTTGIDIVLDGHSHSTIEKQFVKNLYGKDVLLTQTGTKFSHFGKVTISPSGSFYSECIPDSEMDKYFSTTVKNVVDSINMLCYDIKNDVIGHTSFDLAISDENRNLLIRKGETNLGDLICDALMHAGNCRISFINGGGIREGIPAGNITYGDILTAVPYENQVVVFEITGRQIVEVLESSFSKYPIGNGAFLQVGGLRFTFDRLSSPHIRDVQIMKEDSTYTHISKSDIYKVATTNYVLNDTISYPVLSRCKYFQNSYITECQALRQFIKFLGNEIPEHYRHSQKRINISSKN